MNPSRSSLKRFGLGLFYLGVLLAFVLIALMVWADVEAFSYGFPRVGNEPMGGLSCPQFMTATEETRFSLTLRNTTERVLRPRLQFFVSETGVSRWREISTRVEIEPGGRETVTGDVGADDIVLGNFVLIKAYTFASYPQPDVEGTCGIFVVNIPWIRGDVLFWLWLAGSLVLLITGLWLSDFRKAEFEKPSGRSLARKVVTVLAVIGLIIGSAGWWPFGIVILLVIAIALPAAHFIGQ